MKRLSYFLSKDGNIDIISLHGPLYEGIDKLLKGLNTKLSERVTFNFKNMTHTNTCGVAEWIEFLRRFSKGRKIEFSECPPAIVMLINMIPVFRFKAILRSVYRSYYCDACSKVHWHLYTRGLNMPDQATIASDPFYQNELPCQCQGSEHTRRAEVQADEFFSFLVEGHDNIA